MKNLILLLLMVTVQMGFTQPLLIDDLVSSSFGGYNISCNGATDGSIDLTVSGGTLPYSFLWSNGQTSEDITGLAAGIYTVTVTDGAAVTQSASITLTEPDPLFVPVSALTYNGGWNVSCYNASDGFI
ncbi:MAG: SprB repeat-containing protein, partial [Flavobacteriales bacterium]|nr:SprB repeat-containing protein [Flavobacteriales bacterium]